jgi:PII-like signaling protein
MLEVTIFLDEDDMINDQSLYQYIMKYLLHHHIRGASVFTAMGGYGAKRHLHYPRKIGAADEGPLMILAIDEEEKIRAILPHLKEVVAEGLIVLKKVEQG